ncbi:hypothetical protein RCL1_001259 [Eukaryota sp. TZLM3-RCL]
MTDVADVNDFASVKIEISSPPPFLSECLRFLANTNVDFHDFCKTPTDIEVNRLRDAFKSWQQHKPHPFETFLIHPHVVCHFLISYASKHNPPLINSALGQEMLNVCSRSSDDLYKQRALLQLFSLLPPLSRAVWGSLFSFLYDLCQFHPSLCDREDFITDPRVVKLFNMWGEIAFCTIKPTIDADALSVVKSHSSMLLARAICTFGSTPSYFKHKMRSLSMGNSSIITRKNTLRALSEITNQSQSVTSTSPSLGALSNIRSLLLDAHVYIGHVDSQNRPHGSGVILSDDGSLFVGHFHKGKRSGLGSTMTKSDPDTTTCTVSTYEAAVQKGDAVEVTFDSKDVTVFAGKLDQNVKSGHGLVASVSRGTQEFAFEMVTGNFVDNKLEGVVRAVDGDALYTGQLDSKGRRTGVARVVSSKGIFEGFLEDGKPNGHGSWVGVDGERFFGQFVNGVRSGEGTCQFSDGTVYRGQFNDGSFHGVGEITKPSGEFYKGNFVNGERDGEGVFVDPVAGVKFSGVWKSNKKHGKGKEIIQQVEYIGSWNEGVRSGNFEILFPGDVVFSCLFKDGMLSGMAKVVTPHKTVDGDASVLYAELIRSSMNRTEVVDSLAAEQPRSVVPQATA